MKPAFDRYGGFATVSKIVMTFYDKVLDCDVIGHYFEDIDMAKLIDHQTKFVASVMGGPASFSDEALGRIHQPLAITQNEFARMQALLEDTLIEFELDERDIGAVMGEIRKRGGAIVAAGSG